MARIFSSATHRVTDFARWLLTVLLGLVLVIAGIIMLFTPGSGIAAIILGLMVWAREFAWARRALDNLIEKVEARREKLPAFVGRMLDERRRRREIKEAVERAAEGGDTVVLDRQALSAAGRRSRRSRDTQSRRGA